MEAKQIIFTQKDKAELLTVEAAEPKENQVMVKTAFSTISCGTERANITGNPHVSIMGGSSVKFPRSAGYSSSGVVVKVGESVTDIAVGDKVVVCCGKHKTYNTVDRSNVTKIESDKVSMEEAAMMYIATFPLAAIRKTRLEIGESLMVVGLGILGLLAVEQAKAAGAVPIIAVDPVKERRELALKAGADYALDPMEADFVQKVKRITGNGANVAIEVTGKGAGLNTALDCMARFGRVALLGCTRESDFTVDYYHKVHGPGITLIGAHTHARPVVESYPGYFTQQDDIKAMLKLCAADRLHIKELIAETHTPEDCAEVYQRLIFDKNFPPVVQFDWSKLDV